MSRAKIAKEQRALKLKNLVIRFAGARAAESFSIADDFPFEVNALAAHGTGDAFRFVAGQVFRHYVHRHPLNVEEVAGRHFAIREHLLFVLAFDFGMKLAGFLFRRFFGGDANGFAGFEINKGCGHFSPVAEFQSTFAEAASGNDADGIGGAAVYLDVCDKPLTMLALGIVETELIQSVKSHANAENLSGAEMAVSDLGLFEKGVETLHTDSVLEK